jgi:hypothetical protein
MQGTVENGRKRCRQKNWQDNIKEWTNLTIPDLLQTTSHRPLWRRISASSALCQVSPTTPEVEGLR